MSSGSMFLLRTPAQKNSSIFWYQWQQSIDRINRVSN